MSHQLDETINRYRERLEKFGIHPDTLGWTKGKQNLRYASLLNCLPEGINSILDVGCGFSDGLSYLHKIYPNLDYIGVDIVPEFIDISKNRFPNQQFFLGDYKDIEVTKRVDAVIASGVFNYDFGNNYEEISKFIEFGRKIGARFVSFDVLSDNVDFKTSTNFYYNPAKLIDIVQKQTRRFEVSSRYQPFEINIFCDFEDDFDIAKSLYKNN